VIQTFADATTADLFHGANTKAARAIDKAVWPGVRRKLDMVNAAAAEQDLRVPPGNRLKAMKGEQAGRWSIRGNKQYRITSMKQKQKETMTMMPKHRAPTHAGEILLEEFLKPLELTQVEAAEKMGISLNRMNELIRGKRGVTADTALRLAKLLKTTPEFWLNLQNAHDLYEAKHAMSV
jgi:addiction module HigA family antidote